MKHKDSCGLEAAIDQWIVPALARHFLQVRQSGPRISADPKVRVPQGQRSAGRRGLLRPAEAPAHGKTQVKREPTSAPLGRSQSAQE